MPTFLEGVFGRKKPTSAFVRAELAKVEAGLAAAPGRVERAKALLKRVADLSDAEHEAAVAELGAAERAVIRFEAQAAELANALDEAEKAEAATERRARADVARKAMAGVPKLIDRYEEQAAALVTTAMEMEAIVVMVADVNRENEVARRRGLDAIEPIPTAYQRFWSEPDTIEPDREVFDEDWYVGGRRVGAMVTVEHQGRQVPTVAGAELRKVRRIVPGATRAGRRMNPPLHDLYLPAMRLGGKAHWPRGA